MLKKMSYNQMKLFRFVASVLLICVYTVDIAAKPYLPKTFLNILVIVALLIYIVGIFLFVGVQRNSVKVMMDELSKKNEAKAAQFTYLLLTIAIFISILLVRLTDESITLNFEVLFCILIAVSAANDGCYLYLERKGLKDADSYDQD